MTKRITPAKIAKNQKILLHPRNLVKIPPRIGPIAGPSVNPSEEYAIYFPRSALVTRSETVPIETTRAPLQPKLWKHRRVISAAKLF